MADNNKLLRKLIAAIVMALALALGLCVTTFALMNPAVSVQDNQFQMGTVKLNLNDDKPIIQAHLFEPGVTQQKTFFVKNEGTAQVYCKLYLENVQGDLADILQMTLSEGGQVLYQGKPADFTQDNAVFTSQPLDAGSRRELTVTFSYPKGAGNEGKGASLSFDVTVRGVQTKNNPDRLFS